MKFKVGDRVRYVGIVYRDMKGKYGTVVYVGLTHVEVKFDGIKTIGTMIKRDLELVGATTKHKTQDQQKIEELEKRIENLEKKKIYKITISKILNDCGGACITQILNVQFTRDEELIKCLEKNHKMDGLYITCEEIKVNDEIDVS